LEYDSWGRDGLYLLDAMAGAGRASLRVRAASFPVRRGAFGVEAVVRGDFVLDGGYFLAEVVINAFVEALQKGCFLGFVGIDDFLRELG